VNKATDQSVEPFEKLRPMLVALEFFRRGDPRPRFPVKEDGNAIIVLDLPTV
jgi:hypothetical protein